MSEPANEPAREETEAADDPRLVAALEEYRGLLDAGARPSRETFLARFSEIAPDLAECLEGLELVHAGASQLRPPPVLSEENIVPGQVFGDFRIVGEIGRGGMGVVYEALQLSLGRRVALKVLSFAAALDQRQLQRFRFEAQAAALLNHPSIVPVFSVGSAGNVHYYAMQLVEGQSLSAVIDGLRQDLGLEGETDDFEPSRGSERTKVPWACPEKPARTSPERTAAWAEIAAARAPAPLGRETTPPGAGKTQTLALAEERKSGGLPAFAGALRGRDYVYGAARLGVQAALALEHAHQLGIVHRDVKPANLLLDQKGHLWIADFGLAQFPRDVRLTAAGGVVGTLRYMSPEQASGRPVIDQRTDIFGLGASLFELLTLRPAFPGSDQLEIERQRAEGLRSLRTLNPSVPHDLETIVLKALAYSPEDRYGSARELADDLQRFLEDQPITARRPSLRKRALLWSRRHRTLVGAGAALVLLALAGLSFSTLRIAREQQKTQAAFLAEKNQRDRAEAALLGEKQQRDRAEEFLRRVLKGFKEIKGIIKDPDDEDDELTDSVKLDMMRKELLNVLLRLHQDFLSQRADDPSLQVELAESQTSLATIMTWMNNPEAESQSKRARELAEQLGRDHPEEAKMLILQLASASPDLLAILSKPLQAAVLRKVDAEKGVVTVAIGPPGRSARNQEITIDASILVVINGYGNCKVLVGKDGLKDERFKVGASVKLARDKNGKAAIIHLLMDDSRPLLARIRKVDAEKGVITVTAQLSPDEGWRNLDITCDLDTKFVTKDFGQMKDLPGGLKNEKLKEDAFVNVHTNDGKIAIIELLPDAKPKTQQAVIKKVNAEKGVLTITDKEGKDKDITVGDDTRIIIFPDLDQLAKEISKDPKKIKELEKPKNLELQGKEGLKHERFKEGAPLKFTKDKDGKILTIVLEGKKKN